MKFKIKEIEFDLRTIIDARRDSEEVKRLTNAVAENDDSYIVHEPLAEDVQTSNDNWSCHMAEELGITFEFSNEHLCYITINMNRDELKSKPIHHFSDDIVIAFLGADENEITYGFGSVKILSDEALIPNRYSATLLCLLDILELMTRRYD